MYIHTTIVPVLLFVYTLVKISLSMNHCRLKDPLEGGEVQIYLLDRLKGAEVGIYPFLVCVMDIYTIFPRLFPYLKFDQYVSVQLCVGKLELRTACTVKGTLSILAAV